MITSLACRRRPMPTSVSLQRTQCADTPSVAEFVKRIRVLSRFGGRRTNALPRASRSCRIARPTNPRKSRTPSPTTMAPQVPRRVHLTRHGPSRCARSSTEQTRTHAAAGAPATQSHQIQPARTSIGRCAHVLHHLDVEVSKYLHNKLKTSVLWHARFKYLGSTQSSKSTRTNNRLKLLLFAIHDVTCRSNRQGRLQP